MSCLYLPKPGRAERRTTRRSLQYANFKSTCEFRINKSFSERNGSPATFRTWADELFGVGPALWDFKSWKSLCRLNPEDGSTKPGLNQVTAKMGFQRRLSWQASIIDLAPQLLKGS